MSINVTVSGNPVSIHRGRMVLSDLDQIKKNERDRRRRLRLEQVRQQSKEMSSRLLERAKNITQEQLSRFEKDGKSELKQMHERKIMDLQQKYQEDMEDIGQAHAAAAAQPNVDVAIEADRKKNRAVALERGKEAAQRLRENAKVEDSYVVQQERLRQVREMENVRSSMVASLPKKSSPKKRSEHGSASSEEGDENTEYGSQQRSSKRKRYKKLVMKKSPGKVVTKPSTAKVLVGQQKLKSKFEPQPGPSGLQKAKKPVDNVDMASGTSKTITDISQLPRTVDSCDSDDQEPRKSIPIVNISPTKADKVARYNPEDYKQNSSVSSDSNSNSPSDDSSYFSDGGGEAPGPKKTTRHHVSLAGSKVQLYDHNTRHKNAYDRPTGIVERVDMTSELNAEDLAREVLKSENADTRLAENRRLNAQRRGNDAILRERVRRDYQTLLQNLDHLSREERKLRASQIHGPPNENIHMNYSRRKECREKRQREMDRAFEAILHDSSPPVPHSVEELTERVVTITPRDDHAIVDGSTRGVWQDAPFCERSRVTEEARQEKENELSRDEQILEMLKKVERQKRLLLREFGADLPNDILNVSMRPLFVNGQAEVPIEQKTRSIGRESPTPEIKVVNMSGCEEGTKKTVIKTKKRVSPPLRKIEIAVQTSRLNEIGAAKDKGVQVQLIQEKSGGGSGSTSEEIIEKPTCYGEEPRVKVVTQEESSSASSGSVVTGVVIDIDKKQVKVTPKKKKSSLRVSKRSSPRTFAKPRSMPTSKVASPIKRSPKSAPASRLTSPKKVSHGGSARVGSPEKKVNICVDKGGLRIKVDPTRVAKVFVDSSTESSQSYLTPDGHESTTSRSHRPYVQELHARRVVKIKDTSDTSTSYASPPPVTSGTMIRVLNSSTPVLEMLDSSANDSVVRLTRRQVSPVSSPETPSPRTIMIPTNVPHPGRLGKILRYSTSTDSQSNDSTIPSLIPNDRSIPTTDPSGYQQTRQRSPERQVKKPSEICTCKNPNCKLLHAKFEDMQDYALNNCPEVLKKYEDLQNMCTERIASLNDLIERVRNEQRGMEFSVTAPSDETILMQIPTPRPTRSDLHSVRKLVDSIEAIHNQLAKTLFESQKIIASEGIVDQQTSDEMRVPVTSHESSSKSKESSSTSTDAFVDTLRPSAMKAKPKMISDVPVNIPEDHLRALTKPRTTVRPSLDSGSTQSRSQSPRQHEDMVEKLSKEILEQSKSFDKSAARESFKESDDFSTGPGLPSPLISPVTPPKRHVSPQNRKDQSSPKEEERWSPELKKDNDFIPVLAGIPKVPSTLPNLPLTNGRGKPPVTRVSGPYRPELEPAGHELSTIVEFDTPDTANRSQGSAKSPTGGKSVRSLGTGYHQGVVSSETMSPNGRNFAGSPAKKRASPVPQRSMDSQISKSLHTAGKPSVHVAPLPAQRTPQTTPRRSPVQELLSTPTMIHRLPSQGTIDISGSPRRPKTSTENSVVSNKDVSTESSDSLPDNVGRRNIILQAQVHPQPVQSSSAEPKSENQNKITSSSSNSFSGLSGISEITSTPTSDVLKHVSSPEEMEAAFKKLGGWAKTTLKKTREAGALSSSSNSDITPMNMARKMMSPVKKQLETNIGGLPDLSDVSSISIKDASKSTERAVLMKGRTSTPNIQNSNSSSDKSGSTTTSSSGASLQDPSDSLTAPNLSLISKTSYTKQSNDP